MKYIFFMIVMLLMGFASCDTIEGPYEETPDIKVSGDTLESVILFEFTGWSCVFCPNGHEMIHTLETNYPERVHAIAIHAGSFADPGNDGPDFTSEVSNALLERFGSPSAFPLGSINSMNYEGLKSPDAWSTEFADAYAASESEPAVYLTMDTIYTDHSIEAIFKIKYAKNLNGTYHLSVFVVENGVIAPQKHFSEGLIEDYEHNHILRASMHNGIIGEQVGVNPEIGTEFEKNYSLSVNGTDWVLKNLSIIAFIYQTETNYVIPTKIIIPKTE